jgi:hypothetical protein
MSTSIHANKDILGEGTPPSFEHALLFKNLQLISRLRKPVLNCGSPKEWDAYDVHSHYTFYDSIDGKYRMFYNNTSKSHKPSGIGQASSIDGIHFVKNPKNPLLSVGRKGEWDDGGLWKCRVMRLAVNDWRMWYGGVKRGKTFFHRFTPRVPGVGYATSKDGITWRKHENNPILTGRGKGWNAQIYDFTPFYDAENNEFIALFYGGGGQRIGIAHTEDGVNWREFGAPIIHPEETTWESRTISPKWLGKVKRTYVLAYEAGITGHYAIGLAYSNNLLRWKRDQRNPILTSRRDGFDSKFVADPSLVIRNDKLRIYYAANNSNGDGNVGLAIYRFIRR